jgi:hypothetical protein
MLKKIGIENSPTKKPQVMEEIIFVIWHQKTKDKTWTIIVRKLIEL